MSPCTTRMTALAASQAVWPTVLSSTRSPPSMSSASAMALVEAGRMAGGWRTQRTAGIQPRATIGRAPVAMLTASTSRLVAPTVLRPTTCRSQTRMMAAAFSRSTAARLPMTCSTLIQWPPCFLVASVCAGAAPTAARATSFPPQMSTIMAASI